MRIPSAPLRAVAALGCLLVVCSCAGSSSTARSAAPNPSLAAASNPEAATERSPEELMAAVAAARESAQKRPDDSEAWFQLGLGWQRLGTAGSADSAAAAYEKAIEVDPENVEALVHHGLVLEELKRYEDAMGEYTKAANLAPEDPLPYINLGSILYFHYRRTYEAKEALTKALELDPKNADAHFNLGVLFADANMFSEAKVEWEAARGYAPDGSPAKSLAEENLERIQELESDSAPQN